MISFLVCQLSLGKFDRYVVFGILSLFTLLVSAASSSNTISLIEQCSGINYYELLWQIILQIGINQSYQFCSII